YFRPYPDGFKRNILRVSPDILPPGSIHLSEVWVNGEKYSRFDAENLTVRVPDSKEAVQIKVRIEPKQ
ncbi:MAG TPA: N-acyl-D-glucosamine 2-epimerase, partial [Gammaproteobacteria bacterium]|nr:N-acyl-D-glucosamine 2-epimerase [Gammaproteobacteria bacterium]